jgi:hypothetical protein
MSDYKIILYHTPEWRKRLVNKKMKSLPAHGEGRRVMAENDPAATLKLMEHQGD